MKNKYVIDFFATVMFFTRIPIKWSFFSDKPPNLTNDAWVGNRGGPKQHLNIARMRALENNMPLIRVSNNGISAKISNNGKIEKHIALNKREFLDIELGLNIKRQSTYYKMIGKNVSSYFHLVLLLLTILYYSILKKRKKGG